MPTERRALSSRRGPRKVGADAQMLAAATRHHQSGNLQEAQRLYRRILGRTPQHPDALNLLGVLAVQVGKPEIAIDYIGRALRVDDTKPEFHYNLAMAYHATGDREWSIASYERAVDLKPDYVDAISNLGNLLMEQGKVEDAKASYRKAVRLDPANPVAHNNLGVALLARESFDEAADCYRAALRLRPDYAEAHNGLGAALMGEAKYDEAAPCFRDALRLAPDYAQGHNNLGMALMFRGRFDEAVASFREAVRLKPEYAEAHNNLGAAFFQQGWLVEAEECYREALRLKPAHKEAAFNLAQLLLEQQEFDAALAICKDILNEIPDSDDGLAIKAATLERKGEIDAAYAIVRPLVDAGKVTPAVANVFGVLSHHFDCRDEAILLLEKILARPDLASDKRRRVHFTLGKLYDDLDAFDDAFRHFAKGNALRLTHFDEGKLDLTTNKAFEVNAFFSKERLARLPRAAVESELPVFIIGMPRSGTSLTEQVLACHPAVFGGGELKDIPRIARSLIGVTGADDRDAEWCPDQARMDDAAARHLDRLRALDGTADRVTDKLPYNFVYLGVISLLFPRARVIHCVRDPLDTCLSCYFQDFRRGNFHCFDLQKLGAFYVQYQRLMRHWREVLDIPMLEVRYEEHVADPERVGRQMLAFLGLDWDPRCLRFHESQRMLDTASYDQIRRPVYTSSVGRWRSYERHLGPLKEALARTA